MIKLSYAASGETQSWQLVVGFHGLAVGAGIDHGYVELIVAQELLDGGDRAAGVE